MHSGTSNAGRVLVTAIVVAALLLAVAPMQPVRANGAVHTLNVARWTLPTTLTGVSGRETVIKVGDTYHMWYSADEANLYHTSSTTPSNFDAGTACTFTGGTPFEVGSVTVLEEGGTFYMIAYGSTNKLFNIYTSSNGTAWTNGGLVFGGAGLPAYNKIDGPYLFKDGTKYRLYFQVKTPETSPTAYNIYTAESNAASLAVIAGTGDTVDFTLANSNNPVLSPGASGAWDSESVMQPWVVKDGGVYYMWYSAHAGGGTNQKIGLAYSSDGYSWTKSPGNPILKTGTGVNDAEPSVIKDGNTWLMWYDEASLNTVKHLTATGPFEFSSIQSAVTAASAGDTILVAPGTYTEHIKIEHKTNLILKSTAGADNTIIRALQTHKGTPDPAISIWDSSGITIEGFTIKDVILDSNGEINDPDNPGENNDEPHFMAAVHIWNSENSVITHNIISNFWMGVFMYGGPEYYSSSSTRVHGNQVINNMIDGNNVALNGVYLCDNTSQWVYDNLVEGNTIKNCHRGVWVSSDNSANGRGCDALTVRNNTIIGSSTVVNWFPSSEYKNPPDLRPDSGIGVGFNVSKGTVLVEGNSISLFDKGIWAKTPNVDPSKITVQLNNITGNISYGALNENAITLNATNNWWGNASGPKDTKTLPGTPNYNNPAGTGDAVSSYVEYKPWQVTPGLTGYTLTVTSAGNGTVVQSPPPVSGLYAAGTTVQLTAVPGTGAAFVGWSGDVTGTTNPATIAMTGNKTVSAAFGTASYPITATAGAGGTITPSGTVPVLYGATQAFVITADRGYFIDHLVVDGAAVIPENAGTWTYTFPAVAAPHTIEAVFVVQPDRTPPDVTLPTVGGVDLNSGTALLELRSSTLSLGLTATDASGIGRVVVRVNGIVQTDAWGLGTVPVLTLPEGMNTVELTVEDTRGNRTTRSFRVLADTHGPTVTLPAPVPATVTGTAFTLNGSISDPASGYASLTVNGTPVIPTLTGEFEVQVPLTRGANTITVEAVDRLGNRTTQTLVVTSVVPQARQHLITLEIGSPYLTVDGISQRIDAQGSAPVIQQDRTLLPIRVIVESLGGRIEWNARESKVTIVLASRTLELWIGKPTATVSGVRTPIDSSNPKVVPVIIKGRTYLPVRFIAENLGGSVSWDPASQTVTITSMN